MVPVTITTEYCLERKQANPHRAAPLLQQLNMVVQIKHLHSSNQWFLKTREDGFPIIPLPEEELCNMVRNRKHPILCRNHLTVNNAAG